MAVLMLIFMICATRTNIVYTLIFLTLLVVFLLLSSAYWLLAEGSLSAGNKCVKVSIYLLHHKVLGRRARD
jgi:succinate-acetate transporter protein